MRWIKTYEQSFDTNDEIENITDIVRDILLTVSDDGLTVKVVNYSTLSKRINISIGSVEDILFIDDGKPFIVAKYKYEIKRVYNYLIDNGYKLDNSLIFNKNGHQEGLLLIGNILRKRPVILKLYFTNNQRNKSN